MVSAAPRAVWATILCGICMAAPVGGQGLTTAAVEGTVRGPEGEPVEAATVVLTHSGTGHRWTAASDREGRYAFENVPVGGPYQLEIRRLGFSPGRASHLSLSLGERRRMNITLGIAAAAMAPVEIAIDRTDAELLVTGPTHVVSDSLLARAPVLKRNLLALVLESPQAVPGMFGVAIGGQNPHGNNIQIDGGGNTDLYGLLTTTPGGALGATRPGQDGLAAVPLDAIDQLQVLAAPFDVRYGSFIGGVINAVTRSGTNEFDGTFFQFFQHHRMTGALGSDPPASFRTLRVGGTVSGPIVRDRLHFFASVEVQRNTFPYDGPHIRTDDAIPASNDAGIRLESVLRFQQILRERYGVDPGEFGPVDVHVPSATAFAKVTGQLGRNSFVELSVNRVQGSEEGAGIAREPFGVFALSSQSERNVNRTNGVRLGWSINRRRFSNELLLSFLDVHDFCRARAEFTGVTVAADGGLLRAGRQEFCPTFGVRQRSLELTDNVTLRAGAHVVLLGTHHEFLHVTSSLFPFVEGMWTFGDLDALERGQASDYFRNVPGALAVPGTTVDLHVRQLGAYAQDLWSVSPRLLLIGGVRVDLARLLDQPRTNSELLAELGIDTGESSALNALWSPRLAVRFDARGDGSLVLRGGLGLFAGRPAFDVPAAAQHGTGLERLELHCRGSDVPPFTPEPVDQPTSCLTSSGTVAPVTFVGPEFAYPQVLKASLGASARLPAALDGMLDLMYTRATHQPFFQDVNLLPPIVTSLGEGGRALYGTIDRATGRAVPRRRSDAFAQVTEQTARDGDYSYSASVGLGRRFQDGIEASVSYTYSVARDVMSELAIGFPEAEPGSTPLDGSPQRRRRRPSAFDTPHKVRLSTTMNLPGRVVLSAIYQGISGSPYTYVIFGDANADGFPRADGVLNDDIVYVPRDRSDITLEDPSEFDGLDALIQREPCLRNRRGRLAERNACRDPWQNTIDVRAIRELDLWSGERLALEVTVFNIANLLSRDWGLVRRTPGLIGVTEVPLLALTGYDEARGRGRYIVIPIERRSVDLEASRWRAQLGARLTF